MRSLASRLSLGLALLLLWPETSWAYEFDTHAAIVQRAVEAMETLAPPTVLNPQPPPGVSSTDFAVYLTAVREAPPDLKQLRTGLPNKLPDSGFNPLPFVGPGDDPYPFHMWTTEEPDPANPGETVTVTQVADCEFNPHHNLSDLSQFTIADFPYLPQRVASMCGLTKAPPNTSTLGPVLGWHAGSIDDHYNDSVMWFKPTNAGGASVVKELATDAANVVGGALIAPFYCLAKLFKLEVCDPDDIYALAEQYNPVTQIDGLMPGFGDVRSDIFTGLWHFINVDETGHFNNHPGMHYTEAGPNNPGVFDIAAIAGADLVGLSLNAYASDGDDRYGDLDTLNRFGPAPWMTYSMAHIEFSPLDNLAQYGWTQYVNSGYTNAKGLAWPLHAIGDATAPQHVVGTSSHGHRPYELAVDNDRARFFPTAVVDKDAQMNRILTQGYQFWTLLQTSGDIRAFIETLAGETRARVALQFDWAYEDELSLLHLIGFSDFAQSQYLMDDFPQMLDLVELGSAATVAFLAYAGAQANTLPPGNTQCPLGTEFKAFLGCVPEVPNQCVVSIAPCVVDLDCPFPGLQVCSDNCCLYRVD